MKMVERVSLPHKNARIRGDFTRQASYGSSLPSNFPPKISNICATYVWPWIRAASVRTLSREEEIGREVPTWASRAFILAQQWPCPGGIACSTSAELFHGSIHRSIVPIRRLADGATPVARKNRRRLGNWLETHFLVRSYFLYSVAVCRLQGYGTIHLH